MVVSIDSAFFIGDNFNNDMRYGVYGVLDGHGGKEVAEYLSKNFVTVFSIDFSCSVDSINSC